MSGDVGAGTGPPEHPDPAVEQLVRVSFARQGLMRHLGASIVGIERSSAAPIVNPGPDEELLPGDRVLVLGNAEQLAAARRMLAS